MIRNTDYNRKMTWLLQQSKVEEFNALRPPEKEMGREINTIGSKASHAEMQKYVVQMKDELEKIKEQLNNVL